ncbi:hypothetical protein BGZ99_003838 [Dissophora globulifera]|uniref:Uncharacterized protein n=1 Tax=Dissophora globulifera TaxID=979702 RepID=A0A9P6RY05_9FUNG|nr:hypothetical protein BGZ99_003838 [Dissophora globulifera]
MPFRAPPPADIPLFVQQAMSEYERAMDQYDKRLKGLKTRESDLVMSTTSSIPPEPSLDPPTLPLLVVQHQLRNLRHYPESVASPHPAFRATFVISKKQVSKLAVHRNLARKKLAAAVEMTFREHARQGYEFMIFAKQACMTTSQEKLKEYMITALKNPGLYGERASKQQNRASKIANTSSSDITHMNDRASTSSKSSAHKVVAVRWKNNQPPLHKDWWRHANPNPLGRVQQSNAYLDMFCEKPTKISRTIPQSKER